MSRDHWSFLFYGIYLGVDAVEAMMTVVPAVKTKVNVYGRHSGELEGKEDFIEVEEHQVLTVDGKDYRYYNDQDWDDVKKGLSRLTGLACDTHMVDGEVVALVVGAHLGDNATSKKVIEAITLVDGKKKEIVKAFKWMANEGWAVVTTPTLMSLDCSD